MEFDCLLSWETSDVISIVSAVLAGASAISAVRSAREAKRANHLTLYAQRRPVYDAFKALDMHMKAKRRSADMMEVSKFYHYQDTALFCFDDEISRELQEYYRAAFSIADEYRANQDLSRTSDEVNKHLSTIDRLSKGLPKKLQKVLKAN